MRAARAYAGLSVAELADRVGIGAKTLKRVETAERLPRQYELWAIADVCGVPRDLFETDGRPLQLETGDPAALDERLQAIEDALKELLARLEASGPGSAGRA